ncbi:MAG: ERCC4 domain-containing protein [Erysipelotrichaceae bacterium]|nr:ERCC4 domain-containing protein [Erysipelotrichaceae bacterium]
MIIEIDTREKPKAIEKIIDYFQQNEIKYIRSKLYYGDYRIMESPLLVIDRKQNIAELAKNCTVDHKRFRAELERCKDVGGQLVILVEQNVYSDRGNKVRVKDISDLMLWSSPHTTIRGEQVFRVLASWCARYPVRVEFCEKRCTGKRIIEILKEGTK